jgi:hypothetical protein
VVVDPAACPVVEKGIGRVVKLCNGPSKVEVHTWAKERDHHLGALARQRVNLVLRALRDGQEANQHARRADIERRRNSPLGSALAWLGSRLRFSRAGVDAMLERPPPLRRAVARGVLSSRVPSPRKATE